MTDDRKCLQCGETKASLKAGKIVLCGVVEGYYEPELVEEWPRHRWVDWTDRELALFGLRPEAFEQHRRTPAMHMPWLGCEELVRGHRPLTQQEIDEDAAEWAPRPGTWWGLVAGQCPLCGKVLSVTETTA